MRVLILLVSLALVACGGSGGGGNSQPPGGSSPPFGGFLTVHVTGHSEIEPNNSLAAANPQTMPTHGANADYVGFGVSGDVNDAADPADYFVFTASRTHVFTIQMCPSFLVGDRPCSPLNTTDIIDTSVAYFEILDQNGVLLLSSQGDIAAGNFQDVSIDAGVANYLAVLAEDTVGATQSYYIVMVEKAPFP